MATLKTIQQQNQARWHAAKAIYEARRISPPVDQLRAVVGHVYGFFLPNIYN